jgi:hypothetical protein
MLLPFFVQIFLFMQIYFTFRVDKESKEKNDMAQDLS